MARTVRVLKRRMNWHDCEADRVHCSVQTISYSGVVVLGSSCEHTLRLPQNNIISTYIYEHCLLQYGKTTKQKKKQHKTKQHHKNKHNQQKKKNTHEEAS